MVDERIGKICINTLWPCSSISSVFNENVFHKQQWTLKVHLQILKMFLLDFSLIRMYVCIVATPICSKTLVEDWILKNKD